MANNNNNNNYNNASTYSHSAIWSDEMSNSSPTYADVVPTRHVAPEYGTRGRDYGDKSNSSPIPTWGRDTVTVPDERYHVAWEDRSTGSYYRYNTGVQGGGESYRWYENVKVRDAESGYEAKYHAEEKYERVPHDHANDHDDHDVDDHDHDADDHPDDDDAAEDDDDDDDDEW